MATRAKIVLTIQQRLDVLKDLEKCHISTVAKKYGVSPMTICRIRNNAAKIFTISKRNKHQKQRKTIREPLYQVLEDHLILWFAERKALGYHISDHVLMEKAIELRDTIGSCSTFKVSRGWLGKFKRRHNIHVVKVFREKSRQNKVTAQRFVEEFKQLIKEEDVALENLYNMDETSLLWRALPTKPRTGVQKKGVGGFKLSEDKITIGLCANATGTHKIMPLVVYNYKKPMVLKDRMETPPVVLKSQNNAWLTREIFIDWYNNYFIPSVRRYHSEKGISGKVILLVDDCLGHKNLLNHPQDDHFKIVYLPTNTALLIQPMDQGIVMKTKRGFRHRMMQTVLNYRGLKIFCKRYNLQHCIDMLALSWDAISIGNIKNAWNKIIDSVTINVKEEEEKEEEEEDNLIREMQSFMTAISKQYVTLENVRQFLYYCEMCERRCFADMEEGEEDDDNEIGEDNEIENGEDNEIENEEDTEIENENEDQGHQDESKETNNNRVKNEEVSELQKPVHQGINISEEQEEELQYIFRRLESYNPYVPRTMQLHLEAMKICYLGDPEK